MNIENKPNNVLSKPNNFITYADDSARFLNTGIKDKAKKINPYLYSFSGSDTLISICFEKNPQAEVKLESVNTISISIHEQKTPVRRLGCSAPVGFTSSMRVIGGSIIMTAVNGHPLQALVSTDLGLDSNPTNLAAQGATTEQRTPDSVTPANPEVSETGDPAKKKQNSTLKKRKTNSNFRKDIILPYDSEELDRANYLGSDTTFGYFKNNNKGMPLCTVLPPMQIRLLFVSEYINQIVPGFGEIILNNVNFVSENIVMSVNNMVTEFVLQFVASDMKEFNFTETDIRESNYKPPVEEGQEEEAVDLTQPQQTSVGVSNV